MPVAIYRWLSLVEEITSITMPIHSRAPSVATCGWRPENRKLILLYLMCSVPTIVGGNVIKEGFPPNATSTARTVVILLPYYYIYMQAASITDLLY